MARIWEVRGLFGNEYAMETAVQELKKLEGIEWEKLDRRNLHVRLKSENDAMREKIKKIIKIAHGYIEADSPLGEFDRQREKERVKKLKETGKKKGH